MCAVCAVWAVWAVWAVCAVWAAVACVGCVLQLEQRYRMWKVKRERYLSGAGGDPELTPRGVHKVMHLGAITHRGPPHVTPRGLEVRCMPLCTLVF